MVFIDLKVPSICTSVFVQEEFEEEDTELPYYELTVLYFYTPLMSALMLHDKF